MFNRRTVRWFVHPLFKRLPVRGPRQPNSATPRTLFPNPELQDTSFRNYVGLGPNHNSAIDQLDKGVTVFAEVIDKEAVVNRTPARLFFDWYGQHLLADGVASGQFAAPHGLGWDLPYQKIERTRRGVKVKRERPGFEAVFYVTSRLNGVKERRKTKSGEVLIYPRLDDKNPRMVIASAKGTVVAHMRCPLGSPQSVPPAVVLPGISAVEIRAPEFGAARGLIAWRGLGAPAICYFGFDSAPERDSAHIRLASGGDTLWASGAAQQVLRRSVMRALIDPLAGLPLEFTKSSGKGKLPLPAIITAARTAVAAAMRGERREGIAFHSDWGGVDVSVRNALLARISLDPTAPEIDEVKTVLSAAYAGFKDDVIGYERFRPDKMVAWIPSFLV